MNKLLKLLLISAFFNACSWIVLIPIWQYPDEQAHFAQVQNFAETDMTIPKSPNTSKEIILTEKVLGTFRDGFGNNKYTYHPEFNIEYSNSNDGVYEETVRNLPKSTRTDLIGNEATVNPPLYYALGAIFYKGVGSSSIFERVFAVRFFSLILFLPLIFITFKISQIIFKNNNELQYTLTAVIAFNPMLVFASTGVLPDSLTNLLFTIIILISLLILNNGLNIKYLIFALLTIIAGSLTRQQFLITLPILSIAVFLKAIIDKKIRPIFVLMGLIITLVSLSSIVPQLRYLQSLSSPEIEAPNFKLLLSLNFIIYLRSFLVDFNNQTFAWYWGVYRWLSLTLPPVIYQTVRVFVLLSLSGLFIKIIKDIFQKNFKGSINLYFLIIASLIYTVILVTWDYFFRINNRFSFGIQGRYFFPLVVAHLAILIIGFKEFFDVIFKNYSKYVMFAIVALFIVFNDLSLFHVASSYYSTSSLISFLIQASQYKPDIFKGSVLLSVISLSLATQVLYVAKLIKSNANKVK